MFYSTKQVLYDNIASNMTKIICYSQGIFLNNKKKKSIFFKHYPMMLIWPENTLWLNSGRKIRGWGSQVGFCFVLFPGFIWQKTPNPSSSRDHWTQVLLVKIFSQFPGQTFSSAEPVWKFLQQDHLHCCDKNKFSPLTVTLLINLT